MATEEVYALAKISENVYSLQDGVNQAKLDEGLSKWGYSVILDSTTRDNDKLHMAVWKNEKNCVLAFKGTDFDNMHDIEQDLRMILGGNPSKTVVNPSLARAKQLADQYGVNLITGHSLGGYLAEIFATNNNYPGIGFCAPGTNGPLTKLGGSVVRGFHNVNFETDFAGNVLAGYYGHVQWSIYVECNGPTHGVAYMVAYFKNRDITNMDIQSRSKSYPTGYYYPK